LAQKGRFLFPIEFFPFNLRTKREKLWGAAPGKASPGVLAGVYSGLAGQGNTGKVVSKKKFNYFYIFCLKRLGILC